MSTNMLLRIILFPIFVFSSIVCTENTNPVKVVEVENKSPIIVSEGWSLLANSPGDYIWAMSVSTEGVFYIGVEGGLFRSFDNGLSWEQVYSSGTPLVIYISPYDSVIVLSLSGTFHTTTVYSTDKGQTWKESNEQPQGSSVHYYLSLPSGEILAGGWGGDESTGGIYISKDKCVSWKRVPDFVNGLSVLSFALNSANDVYAVISSSSLSNGTAIYCSKDKGQSWVQVRNTDSLAIYYLVININDALIFGNSKSIFISESNTDNWKSLDPSFHDGLIDDLGIDSNDNLLVTFFDVEDNMTKVLLYSELSNNWYSIEGSNLPETGYPFSTLVGKDHHIYLATFGSGIYKTKLSIDEILKLN